MEKAAEEEEQDEKSWLSRNWPLLLAGGASAGLVWPLVRDNLPGSDRKFKRELAQSNISDALSDALWNTNTSLKNLTAQQARIARDYPSEPGVPDWTSPDGLSGQITSKP
jgi:hypothetical protein